jgi:PAP2 superfamily
MRRGIAVLSVLIFIVSLTTVITPSPALAAETTDAQDADTPTEPPAPVMAPNDDLDPQAAAAAIPGYLERYSRPFLVDTQELKFTQKYYWTRLFHPGHRDKLWGAGVLMTALALFPGKREIQDDVAESDSPGRKNFFKQAQQLGGQGYIPAAALLFYLGGSTFHEYRAKQTGVMLAESLFLTGILTGVGMWALNEQRPREGGALHPFAGLGHGVSGHSSTAASISGVLSGMYLQIHPDDGRMVRTWKWIGKGLAYGAPVLVAFGRVNEQQHFAYNTVLGLGIGYWTGHVVADAHGAYLEQHPSRLRPSAVGPIVGADGGTGLGARWDF